MSERNNPMIGTVAKFPSQVGVPMFGEQKQGESKIALYFFNPPSPAQKKAVMKLMEKYEIPYPEYRQLQKYYLEHGSDEEAYTKMPEREKATFNKIQELSFDGELDSEIFSIWASRAKVGFSEKTAEEKEHLRTWYYDNGGEVSIGRFFISTN